MRKRSAACMLWALVAAGWTAASAATVADLVERASPSVVYIEGDRSCGSGFVVRTDPHIEIATNHHVIRGGGIYTVSFFLPSQNGRQVLRLEAKARATFAVKRIDYGRLRVDPKDPALARLRPDLKALPLGDSRRVRPGERVFLIGSPVAGNVTLGNSVSDGIVSGRNRFLAGVPHIQTTAPVNFGNSGGPLLNMSGQVIGIVTSKSTHTDNIGFALPIHMTDPREQVPFLPERLGAAATARMEAGTAALRAKRFEDACAAFRKAQQAEPGKATPLMGEGYAREQMGRAADAVRLFQKAAALEDVKYDDLVLCHLALGQLHGRAGRTEAAIATFRTGLVRNPMHAELNRNIGVAYANSGRKAKALAHWYISLTSKPNQPDLRRDFVTLLGR